MMRSDTSSGLHASVACRDPEHLGLVWQSRVIETACVDSVDATLLIANNCHESWDVTFTDTFLSHKSQQDNVDAACKEVLTCCGGRRSQPGALEALNLAADDPEVILYADLSKSGLKCGHHPPLAWLTCDGLWVCALDFRSTRDLAEHLHACALYSKIGALMQCHPTVRGQGAAQVQVVLLRRLQVGHQCGK